MGVTLKQLAERAGVSITTARDVVNGQGQRFSEAVCTRVEKIAAELNYSPNIHARGLRSQRTYLLGIIAGTVDPPSFHTDFQRGVLAAIAGLDYAPIVFTHHTPSEAASAIERCLHRHVEGLVVGGDVDAVLSSVPDAREALLRSGVPLVQVGFRTWPDASAVTVDFHAIFREITRHLLDLGHRSIAMLTHGLYRDHADSLQMFEGYAAEIGDAGLDPCVITHTLFKTRDYDASFVEGGRQALDSLLSHADRPTAVVCYTDDEACGLLQACRERGVDVPGQLAVSGYGDEKAGRIGIPSLTTTPRPAMEEGRAAIELLLRRIAGEPADAVKVNSHLIVRESTAGRAQCTE